MPWYTDGNLVGLPFLTICYVGYGLLLIFYPRWSSRPLHGFLEFIHPKLADQLTPEVAKVLGGVFLLMAAQMFDKFLMYLTGRAVF